MLNNLSQTAQVKVVRFPTPFSYWMNS
uniref:Uncharacterized protein n=1 Tax=Arundo donax TaxID=35708 RepID=A0A0A9C6B1_ARUDO